MILIIEPVCEGLEHAAFNSAMLLCAQDLAGTGAIEFHAEPTHLQAVTDALQGRMPPGLSLHPLQTAPREPSGLGRRLGRDLAALRSALGQPRAQRPSLVVVTCVGEDTLLAAKLLFGVWHRQLPVLVVLHSVLHSLLYSRKRRLLLGLGQPPRMRTLVLGRHIRQRVQELFPWLARRLDTIRHPYAFEAAEAQPLRAKPIRFGFVGLGNRAKGFDLFLAAIETLGARHPEQLGGSFHLIGRVDPSMQARFEAFRGGAYGHLLDLGACNELPLADFQAAVRSMDYLVMPYEASMYDLACSGSSLDAFAYIKPVIAFRSRYFEGLFADAGDIGHLCNSQDDLTECIQALAFNSAPERYAAQQRNLMRGRTLFEPEAVAEEILAILPDALKLADARS
jgi:glycosyltransferase involved in cell wall biosynthesis